MMLEFANEQSYSVLTLYVQMENRVCVSKFYHSNFELAISISCYRSYRTRRVFACVTRKLNLAG